MIYRILLFVFLFTFINAYATQLTEPNIVPPPIPVVNSLEFKNYVNKNHTFPSPYGFEAYKDANGRKLETSINQLNPNPYIPVTFYCQSQDGCPILVVYTNDALIFNYSDGHYISLSYVHNKKIPLHIMQGFKFPNDPILYTKPALHAVTGIKKGMPIVTILFSQKTLKEMSINNNGKQQGYLIAGAKLDQNKTSTVINRPLSDGKEFIDVGTTLYLLGLGQASGLEFSETVSQTTGETFSQQIETGMALNFAFEANTIIGGGVIPVTESAKFGINESLSTIVQNGISIANQYTLSRTFTIKPGINDTYYWAIYQLGYSYHFNAGLFEECMHDIEHAWKGMIRLQIASNDYSQDGRQIGLILPPQSANTVEDVIVGVAVPVNTNGITNIYSKIIKNDK